MTTIQAFNRAKLYTHIFPDVTLVFKPNIHGDVVCDVESESAVQRLLMTPSGFRVYQPVAEAAQVEPVAPPPMRAFTLNALEGLVPAGELVVATPEGDKGVTSDTQEPVEPVHDFVLCGPDGSTFDLKPLDDAALREFAAANGINIHHAAKGDTIRMRIVAALMAPAAPSA